MAEAPLRFPEPLAFPFDRDDFSHELLERHGDACLVARRNLRTESLHWEVVLVQRHPAETIRGHAYPAREAYPPDSAWGDAGWTYPELTDAKLRLRFLVESPDRSRDAWEQWWPAHTKRRPG